MMNIFLFTIQKFVLYLYVHLSLFLYFSCMFNFVIVWCNLFSYLFKFVMVFYRGRRADHGRPQSENWSEIGRISAGIGQEIGWQVGRSSAGHSGALYDLKIWRFARYFCQHLQCLERLNSHFDNPMALTRTTKC